MENTERNPLALDYIFHPRSVAVAGASNAPLNLGQMFLMSFHDFGLKGNVYAVHPEGSEVGGLKCYPSVKDIPGPVDYVFGVIPARFTPQLMEDCVVKGVKVVSFFTAGFSETGEAEGKELEAEIVKIARRGGIRVLGPNCVGIYCPSAGLSFSADFSRKSGPLSLLCQSGGNFCYLVRASAMRGVYINKAVGYGNACDINETDLLEYFAHDPETRIIGAYIEGVKDGKRFLRALKEAAQAKPVIILKGGRTGLGASTAASHTGALAGSASIWSALIQQTGAIQVNNLEEMIDMASLFAYMPRPKGKKVGIIGLGGGASVLSADDFAKAGLSLPPLSEGTKERLRCFTTAAGNILSNPVDTQSFSVGPKEFAETLRIVGGSEQVDIFLLHIAYDELPGVLQLSGVAQLSDAPQLPDRLPLADVLHMGALSLYRFELQTWIDVAKQIGKPAAAVLHYTTLPKSLQAMCEDREICGKAGLPIFYSTSAAANAISKFLQYHDNRD